MATRLTNLALRRLNVLSKLPSNPSVSTCPKRYSIQSRQHFLPCINLSATKSISTSALCLSDKNDTIDEENDDDFEELEDQEQQKRDDWMANYTGDPKDRTRIIPLEKSLAYMESDAYRQTYGNHRVILIHALCFIRNDFHH